MQLCMGQQATDYNYALSLQRFLIFGCNSRLTQGASTHSSQCACSTLMKAQCDAWPFPAAQKEAVGQHKVKVTA